MAITMHWTTQEHLHKFSTNDLWFLESLEVGYPCFVRLLPDISLAGELHRRLCLWVQSTISRLLRKNVGFNIMISKNSYCKCMQHNHLQATLYHDFDGFTPSFGVEKPDFVQKFVLTPKKYVSVRKRFVFDKLTNLCWHPYWRVKAFFPLINISPMCTAVLANLPEGCVDFRPQ